MKPEATEHVVYLAGQALRGMCARSNLYDSIDAIAQSAANLAIATARALDAILGDEMLKDVARAKERSRAEATDDNDVDEEF